MKASDCALLLCGILAICALAVMAFAYPPIASAADESAAEEAPSANESPALVSQQPGVIASVSENSELRGSAAGGLSLGISANDEHKPTPNPTLVSRDGRTSAELSDDGVDYRWLYRRGDYWYRVDQYPEMDSFLRCVALGTDGEFYWDRANIENYPGDNEGIFVSEISYGDGTLVYQRGPHVRLESVVAAGSYYKWTAGMYSDHLYKTRQETARYGGFVEQDVFPRISCVRSSDYVRTNDIKLVIFDKTLDRIWGYGYKNGNGVYRFPDDALVYLSRWFEGCTNLERVEGFEHIDTSDVLSMAAMFKDCGSLEALDLSSLDTTSCENFSGMFDGCVSLVTLKTGEGWSQSAVDSGTQLSGEQKGKATFPVDMFCERDGSRIEYTAGDIIPDGPAVYTVTNRQNIRDAQVTLSGTGVDGTPVSGATITCEYSGQEVKPSVSVVCNGKQLVEGTHFSVSYADNVEDGVGRVCIRGEGAYVGYKEFDFNIEDNGAYAFVYANGTMMLKKNHHLPDESIISRSIPVSSISRCFDKATALPGSVVPWSGSASRINRVIIDKSFADVKPATTKGWFKGCSSLAVIEGWQYLNLSSVTSTEEMFAGCSALTSVSLANANLSRLESMRCMFKGCVSLRSMSLSGAYAPNVVDARNMFEGCSSLGFISLANARFNNMENASCFLKDCTSLAGVSLAGMRMPNVKDMSRFFEGCTALDGVSLAGANVSNAQNVDYLFKGCQSLTGISLANVDLSKAVTARGLFQDCTSLNIAALSGLKLTSAQDLSGFFSGCSLLGMVSLSNVDLSSAVNVSDFFRGCTSLETVSLSGAKLPRAQDLSGFFSSCAALKNASLAGADLPSAQNLSGFFEGCSMLSTVNLKGANLSSASDMSGFFAGCSALSNISLANVKLPKANDLSGFFVDCKSLESATLSGADMSAVRDLSGFFRNCSSLTRVELEGATLSNVKNMDGFFQGCTSLADVSLKELKAPSAQNLSGFFSGCTALSHVDFTGLSLPKATNFNGFFSGCSALVNLDLSGLEAPQATDVGDFLNGCSQLETLAIGGLASAGKANVSVLLAPCPNVKTLKTTSAWRNAAASGNQLKFASRAYRMSPTYARCEAGSAVPAGAGEYRLSDLALQFTKVVMDKPDYTCTGKAIKPAIKVMLGDVQLQEGVDYSLAYKNNVYPGNAKITISGKGTFSGGLIVPFKVVAQTTKVGDRLVYKTKDVTYTLKVTSVKKKKGMVTSVKTKLVAVNVKSNSLRTMSIPDSCTIGNVKVDITEVTAKLTGPFRNVTCVYIGAKVVKIGPRAFAKAPKVKKLLVKSARLQSVKNCLKSSNVRRVETRVYLSKSKRATYKKWFTKKAGKSGVKFVYGLYFVVV